MERVTAIDRASEARRAVCESWL